MIPRTDFLSTRLQAALHQLFGDLDGDTLAHVQAFFEWVDLPGGAYLCRQGDEGDSLYVLISGRLKVLRNRVLGGPESRGEISRGETVGEMALITGEARSADVLAMRDCLLARLSKEGFTQLIQQYPRALIHISKTIIERLRRHTGGQRLQKNITNICVLPISSGLRISDFAGQLEKALARHGKVLSLSSAAVDVLMAQPGLAQSNREQGGAYRQLTSWLEAQESAHRFVLYYPDETETEWTRRCLRQADEILLIGDAVSGSPELSTIERSCLTDTKRLTIASQTLALLHPADTDHPRNTHAWLAHRQLAFHHHLRRDRVGNWERLARFLSGTAVGLVLSGGAAKGFAHVGVFRALEEAGIVVDMVGGTSIGAVMGALVARGWSGDKLREECRRAFRKSPTGDFNLVPRISLFKGKKLDALLHEAFSDEQIEDSWLNFFCVSCNLTRTHPHEHRSGSLLEALRASISIPGVFPPAEVNHDLYVDGGVFNNMPVDVMSQLGAGKIIAVDLQMYRRQIEDSDGTVLSKLRRRLPNILFVVMESSMLSGRHRSQEYQKEVDLYFNPPLLGVSLIDWGKFDKIEAIGYVHAKEVLGRVKSA